MAAERSAAARPVFESALSSIYRFLMQGIGMLDGSTTSLWRHLARALVLYAGLLLCSSAQAQLITLTPVPPDPASADEYFVSISDNSTVTITIAGSTVVDWVEQGGKPGGGGGVLLIPSLGTNNDGKTATSFTLTGPINQARTDFDGTPFSGGQVTIGSKTLPLTLSAGTWSADFGGTPVPPNPNTGTADLSWNAVTQDTQGNPITIASYRVYWGTSLGGYPTSASTPNTSYSLTALAPNTYYFVVTAISSSGVESAQSSVATKIIGTSPIPVDCVVSSWTQGIPQPAICPANGMQTRTDSRTVTTQPANGGQACPALTQTLNLTCTPPPPVDPCVSAPLQLPTSIRWPTARSGARSLSWTSPANIVEVDYSWPIGQKQNAIWKDDRGCAVSVSH